MRDYRAQDLYPHHKVLSSSQFLCYLRSPRDFYTRYVLGLPEVQGPALRLGKGFAEARSNAQFDLKSYAESEKLPKAAVDRLLAALPLLARAELSEHELSPKVGKWKLRATLDGYDPKRYLITEDKTGQVEWNQERVNFDNQLTFQAYAHWLTYGVPPARIVLNWIPTGKMPHMVYRFNTTRSIAKLKQFGRLVETVIANIEAEQFTNPIV